MNKVRINDLARELEVKSKAVLDYLPELGITDKRSHSSALDDDVAEKVRQHFLALDEPGTAALKKPLAPPPVPSAPTVEVQAAAERAHTPEVPFEIHHDAHPLTRTLEQIKADARKALAATHKPLPIEKPAERAAGALHAAGPVTPPAGPRTLRGAAPEPAQLTAPRSSGAAPAPFAAHAGAAAPGKGREAAAATSHGAGLAQTVKPAAAAPGGATKHVRAAAPGKSAASNQPIYPGVIRPKPLVRPPAPRRPGEHRPMHPTAVRPATAAGLPATGAPAPRPPIRRPLAPRVAPHPRVVPARPAEPEEIPITHSITISEGISIKELSEKLEVRAKDVIKRLLDKGIFATINQTLDSQTATEVSRAFGAETSVISYEEEIAHEVRETDRPEDLVPRAPVVTVMGHVDHGKTSLLDAIRETNVTAHEAGGITQHIGAYHVEVKNRQVVFLDTPGHEAFTLMRARGAKVTDIVVLVVAADDGVMPQTLEAIHHARAAKVPIIVAINKIDKLEAQPERVKKQLADQNLLAEDWGGDTVTVEVSAKQRQNLDLLLEMILLVADLQGLKANPHRPATGTVLEGRLDRGRGPVATVLVQNGTLHVGDAFIVGAIYGKVRAMLDDRAHPSHEAPPSTPVEVLGLEDVPQVGDRMQVIEDTLKARQIAIHRQSKTREAALAKSARLSLEQLHEQLAAGEVKELPLIIKGDVQGSVEALTEMLNRLSTEKVKIKVIHAGVGAITEWDVLLASTSNAVVIGFNVRPERKASELAQLEGVDIRLHTIIYTVTEEIKKAMVGLLAVKIKETTLGHAEVRDTFRISKVGTVAGCHIQDGKFARDSRIRLLRDNVVVYEGRVRSLRRFKDDVEEVRSGMECGISLENFNDVKVGDVIEAYVTEKVMEPVLV